MKPNYIHKEFQPTNQKTVICLGKFDGVHIGHQAIIQKVVDLAKEGSYQSLVLAMYPNPKIFFDPRIKITELTSCSTRIKLLKDENVDFVDILKFDQVLSEMTAEHFLDYLISYYGMAIWVVGSKIRFGQNGEGNLKWLQKMSITKGFEVVVQDYILDQNSEIISSTRIRKLVKKQQ
jgi:riboflavin kinase/FMN adenylyltransferase